MPWTFRGLLISFIACAQRRNWRITVREKLEIGFSGYEADTRELFEIDVVKKFVVALDQAFPELFFFCVLKN
jgi:hypothetical protein